MRTLRALRPWIVVLAVLAISIVVPRLLVNKADDAGGGGGAAHQEPERRTTGTYTPPQWTEPGAQERGRLAEAAERSLPVFEGEIGGIYIFDSETHFPNEAALCDGGTLEAASPNEIEASPYRIDTPGYLPPGTFESQAQGGQTCEGDVVEVTQPYQLLPHGGTIFIKRRVGPRFFGFRTSRERIELRQEGGGRELLVIHPTTPEGYGSSAVVIREEFGLTAVICNGLPIEEPIEIARSLAMVA